MMKAEGGKRQAESGRLDTGRLRPGRSAAAFPPTPCRLPLSSFRLPLAALRSGFTLVELMAVVALIGLMMMVVMPSLQSSRGSSLISAARQFSNDLNLARQTAIARNWRIRVVIATEKTIKDSGVNIPDMIAMQYSAYAIMYQQRTLTWWTGKIPNQPNLPYGRDRWFYIQSWKTLPKGVIFDPADSDLRSADGKNLLLPKTTIFFGQEASENLWDGITLDKLPFPTRSSDTDPSKGSEMAIIEFKPNGMPTVPGSVRLINGTVMVSRSGDMNATIVVPGRQTPTTASGNNDPASFNSVVLSWDGLVGKIKWTQPGR
ncbi:MAG: prepilin-type N-terminal cleavage/methylation domain-containing protein [Verrucomicrobia bacterium]|nr:prepilin-type N-terminal cleavage/methylation domain-containing protein [Verrucomicrobiota bacterium]